MFVLNLLFLCIPVKRGICYGVWNCDKRIVRFSVKYVCLLHQDLSNINQLLQHFL
jgi:hypothetical protein